MTKDFHRIGLADRLLLCLALVVHAVGLLIRLLIRPGRRRRGKP